MEHKEDNYFRKAISEKQDPYTKLFIYRGRNKIASRYFSWDEQYNRITNTAYFHVYNTPPL